MARFQRGVSLTQNWLVAHKDYRGDECLIPPFNTSGEGRSLFKLWEGDTSRLVVTRRYICELAHGAPPSKIHQATMTCSTKGCHHPQHMGWKTSADRMRDYYSKNKCTSSGSRPRITKETIEQIKLLQAQNKSVRAVAAELGLTVGGTQYWMYQRENEGHHIGPITSRRLAGIPTLKELAEQRSKIIKPQKAPKLIKPERSALLQYPFVRSPLTETHQVLLAVNAAVPRGVPGREDICQDILVDFYAGRITLEEITPAIVRRYKSGATARNFEQSGYSRSLDMPMYDGRSLHEVLPDTLRFGDIW